MIPFDWLFFNKEEVTITGNKNKLKQTGLGQIEVVAGAGIIQHMLLDLAAVRPRDHILHGSYDDKGRICDKFRSNTHMALFYLSKVSI